MSIDKADHGGETLVRPPTHPVPQLQKPFEESMVESVDDLADHELPMDAMTRRTVLLEGKSYERVIAGRWRQKQGEKYHPLWKLIAQMSFGMHLLAKSMAISEEEVMRILQSHVDDIDGFLERTTEDFDLAQSDIHERIRCLKLPLSHGEVFDRMLEDRTFRASILDGNEKIEHVISRTKRATKDALKDVQKGFDATNVLEKYLSKLNSTWKRDSSEHEAVLVAMLGNAEGWRRAFLELHLQGNKLIGSLKKLAEVVAEMERRAAIVSRNLVVSVFVLDFKPCADKQEARAQKSRHISFQKKSHTLSQMGSIASQKPLPTEPGRHHGSKNSSHSTQLSGLSSRPDSRHDSSRGATSHSSLGPGSRPSTASKRPVKHELHNQSLIGANSTNESLAAKDDDIRRSLNGYVKQAGDIHPIELPADVPENVLRQAPVSIKNRLSMTLGLKPKDYSDHRISSIYYPRALGDLLKTRPMSGLLLTPQSMSAKGTAVHAVSSPAAMSYAETDYYSSHERSPSIGVVTPDNSSGKETNFNKASPRATRSSTLGSVAASASVTRRSSIPNLAFTSHSAVMAMADPPSELPAESPREESIAPSEVRKLSQSQPSSLGEPGPEFTDGATNRTRSASDPVLLVDTSVVSISVVPASAEEETFAAAGQQAQNSTSQEEESSNNRTEAETATAVSDTPDQADVAHTPAHLSDNDMEKIGADGQVVPLATAPEEAEGSQRQFVAELEAAVPRSSVVPIHKDIGPAELEAAPQQTFRLPPRPTATTKNPEKEVPRASIHNLEDFFKLPSAMTLEPGTKTKNFGSVNFQEPIGPLKLELAKRDGKIVPVRVSDRTVNDTAESASNLRLMTVADIIETMSHTPPGSPIHARSNSWASTNSAQRLSHRSSQSLGPPAQARPPPAPGGRSMVDPDFASAGQFDGERKQRKKSTIGGKSGWKTFFSGGGAAAVERPSISIAASTTVSDAPIRPRPSSEAVPRAPYMLAAAGKEVPWFKGTIKRKSRKGNSLA
ncbi:hypothetical protein PV08_06496 [Exophiala spinifera]|uniref:Uncharacterized protein n=1 Tax=Exophiala spinifera TaxID=91928 RepID=A0A0D2BBQ7_9EURO|nr:uncharacterized protein PV08_06496 [Exophiala spinifera]KIW16443.1 hypothetical protein PV08_06496 [Exophiala spinifera]